MRHSLSYVIEYTVDIPQNFILCSLGVSSFACFHCISTSE